MASSSSNPDLSKPVDYEKLKKGWYASPKEYDYWIPEADIEGTVPRDLRGTLLRNGPGLLEVYGKKLKHRKNANNTLISVASMK